KAVEVYQSLPKLLGANGENAVPVKVWLLPLTSLDSTAAKLVRQISIGLVQKCQSVLEDLSDLEMRFNDALRTQTAQQFPQIGKKLKTFEQMCSQFKLEFQRTLAKKLPSIRGGGEEEAVLAEELRKTCSSPFNRKDLNEWMDCKEREIYTVMSLTNMLTNTKIISSQTDLYKESFKAEQATMPKIHTLQINGTPQEERCNAMRHKTKLFSDFAEANKENKNITFLTVGLTNETQKGASIYLYTDGLSVNEDFEPPSKPAAVTGSDINHSSVTLKISPPRFGAEDITSYSVEYCVRGEDGWKQETASRAEEVTVSGLSPNTEYMFRCRAETPVGAGPANEVSGSIQTLPCSPPGRLHVESISREISVSWEKPAELGQDVQVLSYIVEYAEPDQQVKEEDLHWEQMMAGAEEAIISGLQPETEYAVRVRCDCGAAGRSKESIAVNVRTTKREHLKESLKSKGKRINSASPSVYKLPLTEEDMNIDGCRRYNFGKESMTSNRTIMLLGATGSGKSTLINGLINYIVGVEWEDDFRFKLVDEDQSRSQAESKTSKVTVYKINHQEGFKTPFSLTIIDTPGFGDTRGIQRDKEITEQILNLFSSKRGVSEIDAVCFVAQASSARFTATQQYVLDSVLSIFGKDVAENIQVLVTFSDGQRPPVLEAIKVSGVPCPETEDGLPVHFKFNNSALFAQNQSSAAADSSGEEEEGGFDQMFWKMGAKSMKMFFNASAKLTTKSLTMTKEVLNERKQLQVSMENVQKQVKVGLAKIEAIKETTERLRLHDAEISRNKDFKIPICYTRPLQVDISGTGMFITNCQVCNVTCHYPCTIANDADKWKCPAMGPDGNCTQCKGKCHWSKHFNQKYRWEYKEVKEMKTLDDLKEKYLEASAAKGTVQEVIAQLKAEYQRLEDEVTEIMERSAKCLNRLGEIALRPNPLSTPNYIDLLIEGEKSEGKPGWKQRVEYLMEMRKETELMGQGEKPEAKPGWKQRVEHLMEMRGREELMGKVRRGENLL
ncbi:hypothetical protein KUCAC02_036647, partial [Chaenocephalus aceratus]